MGSRLDSVTCLNAMEEIKAFWLESNPDFLVVNPVD
jgi:hypothetical protein